MRLLSVRDVSTNGTNLSCGTGRSSFTEPVQVFGVWELAAQVEAQFPRLAEDVHDELSAIGWRSLLEWIRAQAPEGNGPIEVRSGCEAGSDAAHRRLRVAGFTHRRTFWEMVGPVTEEARTAPAVPSLTIKGVEDTSTFHDMLMKGFQDHWGFVWIPHDEWLSAERSFSGYDPALWFLAEVEGVPAALMAMSPGVRENALTMPVPSLMRLVCTAISESSENIS